MKISAASLKAIERSGEIGEEILGNVVDEDEDQRQAAEEIEPDVATTLRHGRRPSQGYSGRD